MNKLKETYRLARLKGDTRIMFNCVAMAHSLKIDLDDGYPDNQDLSTNPDIQAQMEHPEEQVNSEDLEHQAYPRHPLADLAEALKDIRRSAELKADDCQEEYYEPKEDLNPVVHIPLRDLGLIQNNLLATLVKSLETEGIHITKLSMEFQDKDDQFQSYDLYDTNEYDEGCDECPEYQE